MSTTNLAGTYSLGSHTVHRMGYGAMQLAGPHVFGPPKNPTEAAAVLHAVIEAGIDHIDTSDFYGPYVTNQLIRDTLHPYPENLVLVTKIGARRDEKGGWLPALSRDQIIAAVHSNLTNLGLDTLHVVNFRSMHGKPGGSPAEGSIAEQFSVLAELQQQGLIQHLGVSNITPTQFREAQTIAPVVCVQNLYNIANRTDDLLVDECANQGIAFVPYFPLGGFTPLQSGTLDAVARFLGATAMQVALAWLLRRSPNMLLIPGTSTRTHLAENIAAASLELPDEILGELEELGKSLPAPDHAPAQ